MFILYYIMIYNETILHLLIAKTLRRVTNTFQAVIITDEVGSIAQLLMILIAV